MTQSSKYRTLIADDEQPARDRLKKLLAEHADQIELIGEAQNGLECREMIDRLKPDLVFLDIQMPGLNGFEVLQQTIHSPVVIFCTAYDEFALQAFETNSIDYIVKPIKAERIQKSIEKLDSLKRHSDKRKLHQPDTEKGNYKHPGQIGRPDAFYPHRRCFVFLG